LFSDGSWIDSQVGAVVVLYRRGVEASTLWFHMDLITEHTVFEVEVVGVLLVLHLLKSEW